MSVSSTSMASKRSAPEIDAVAIDSYKKQKATTSGEQAASTHSDDNEHQRGSSAWLRAEVRKTMLRAGIELDEDGNIKLPDERQEIIDELESGSHALVLEHNSTTNAKCRARKCLVNDFNERWSEKIQSPYRINLYATQPSREHWSQQEKPNRRFFHVSCIEAIIPDLAKHLTLPPFRVVQPRMAGFSVSYNEFHPAIIDWVENGGKAFNAESYAAYTEALQKYLESIENVQRGHLFHQDEQCSCYPLPERPKSTELIAGEPSDCKLTDVLFDVLRDGHPVPKKYSLPLLEFRGINPSNLSQPAANAAGQAEADDQTARGDQSGSGEKSNARSEKQSGETSNSTDGD